MSIREYLLKGDLASAIQVLIDGGLEEGLLLMSRLNSANRDNRIGVLSPAEYQVQMNRITAAVIDYAKEQKEQTMNLESRLLDVITSNKRRRPELAKQAEDILHAYRTYNDTKRTTPSYDPVGRRMKAIQADYDALMLQLENEKEQSLEQIVERIAELISAAVPEYHALQEAYTLSSGRGFKNAWIEQQLMLKPDDQEVRISIAEQIEQFTAHINQR